MHPSLDSVLGVVLVLAVVIICPAQMHQAWGIL